MAVEFIEESHTYRSTNGKDINWVSGTGLVKIFKDEFDSKGISNKCSNNKKSKWFGIEPEKILEIWNNESKRSTDIGTWYHDMREKELLSHKTLNRNDKDIPVIQIKYKDKIKQAHNVKLIDGVYPELFVYDERMNVCGQADWVEIYDGKLYMYDYKGFSLNTIIASKDGFIKMKDIEVGDVIFDGNGELTEVEHVSKIHHNPCYEIVTDTNDSFIVDHEHKFVISKRLKKDKYVEVEKCTDELFELKNKEKAIRIKVSKLKLKNKDLPLDPYVLGVWLGDGSASCSMVTNMHDEVWNEIASRGYILGKDISKDNSGKSESRTILNIRHLLNDLNLLNNKHIPDLYMRSSHSQRLDLLRGFMDSDGSYNSTRNRCVMVTTRLWQAESLKELSSSLGFKTTIIKAKASGFGKINIDCFHIDFTANCESPFLVRHKKCENNIGNSNLEKSKFIYIKSIKKIDTIPTKCIAVKSDSKTYLVGKCLLKTHNTNKTIDTKPYISWDGKRKKMASPLEHIDDCNFYHYALQLSIYIFIILRNNPLLELAKSEIHHVTFDVESLDEYGYPIAKLGTDGNPIILGVEKIKVPYLENEVKRMVKHLKKTRKG